MLNVVKSYETGSGIATIHGSVAIEDSNEIAEFREAMRKREVSTMDPRIVWEEDSGESWEYIDFSFQVVNESQQATHIGRIPPPRTADKIAESLCIENEEDTYHVSILNGAKALVDAGRGHWRYLTQYSSLRCLWESKACTPENTDRETCVTTFTGIITD